ncbi:MAG: hypothetical protein RhofKO_18020 [Rhodothermales bacterium]
MQVRVYEPRHEKAASAINHTPAEGCIRRGGVYGLDQPATNQHIQTTNPVGSRAIDDGDISNQEQVGVSFLCSDRERQEEAARQQRHRSD